MKLTFPFRNWAFNSLLELFKMNKIEQFSKAELDVEKWSEEDIDVQFYKNRVPDFESELLQVINTTNQETIDYYFNSLDEDVKYVKSLLTKEYLTQIIEDWNNAELQKYDEQIAIKSQEYAKEPGRKMGHLEKYQQDISLSAIFGLYEKPKKVQKINYNIYCVEDTLKYIDTHIATDYLLFLNEQSSLLIDTAMNYCIPWQEGKIKSKDRANEVIVRPILFCEGDIDVVLIKRAAEVLNRVELISKIDLRYRGSCNNLDKLWSILIDNNWETIPQKKILLYDCDTNRSDEDFGHIHRRTIPKIEHNPVQRGIENLFPETTIQRAIEFRKEFVDFKFIKGTERGVEYQRTETVINKQEKRNFCNWLIGNGITEDFVHFEVVFEIIESLV